MMHVSRSREGCRSAGALAATTSTDVDLDVFLADVDLVARYETLRAVIDANIQIPEKDRATSIAPAEAVFINALIQRHSLTRTLEVGFAYGYSAAYILHATESHHVVIDPYQAQYEHLGLSNIASLGWMSRLEHRPYPSACALPALLGEGRTFQFVFIDGGHHFDQILVDWFYADLLLDDGGFVLFHDAWMRSTQMVASFIRTNKVNYREHTTPLQNLILFQKLASDDARPWYHFEEFYTTRSMDVYRTIKQQFQAAESVC
jgi:predicted O-methyltransferase YrrM